MVGWGRGRGEERSREIDAARGRLPDIGGHNHARAALHVPGLRYSGIRGSVILTGTAPVGYINMDLYNVADCKCNIDCEEMQSYIILGVSQYTSRFSGLQNLCQFVIYILKIVEYT